MVFVGSGVLLFSVANLRSFIEDVVVIDLSFDSIYLWGYCGPGASLYAC